MKLYFQIKTVKAIDNRIVAFQSNANHPLAESMGYIKFEGMQIFYLDLDVTFTLMCDLDLINDLQPHTND